MESKNISHLRESRKIDTSKMQILDEKLPGEGDKITIRIARIGSKKFLIKTGIQFLDWNTKAFISTEAARLQEKDNPYIDENIEGAIRSIRGEEQASLLADYLGVPMPKTRYVEVEGTPCVALDFIEGVVDRGYGSGVVFAERGGKEQEQRVALTKGAIFKYVLQLSGDDGQYLQDPEGNVYISDISYLPVSTIDTNPLGEILLGHSTGLQFFASGKEECRAQLEGVWDEEAQELLKKLEQVTSKELSEIIYGDTNHVSQVRGLVERCRDARRLFTALAQDEETVKAFVKIRAGGQSRVDSQEQRESLYKKILGKLTPPQSRE